MKIIWFFPILLISLFTYSQQVTISGKAKTYKGKQLILNNYSDFITKNINSLDTCVVDTNGVFCFEIELQYTQPVFIELESYLCYLYIEPNKSYQIILPEYKGISNADKLNPFYEPTLVYVGVKNDSGKLNLAIRKFNEIFEGYLEKHNLFVDSHKANVDTFIKKIDSLFLPFQNTYFKNYKYYKYAQLRYLSYERNARYITKEYFLNKPILYYNEAYMELFNQLYKDFFDNYKKTKEGERIYYDIVYGKSYTYAMQTLDNDIALSNDTLRELVLIKGINDAFYNPDWAIKPMLQSLDSVIINTKIAQHKLIAENIKNHATDLKSGYSAPDWELNCVGGGNKELSDYKEKYLYLNFCSSLSFESVKQLDALEKILETYEKYLNIVTICADNDPYDLIKIFKEKGYKWDLLTIENHKDILNKYKIYAYPTYYFIGKNGKLIFSPSPSPEDNFELYFINILRSSR